MGLAGHPSTDSTDFDGTALVPITRIVHAAVHAVPVPTAAATVIVRTPAISAAVFFQRPRAYETCTCACTTGSETASFGHRQSYVLNSRFLNATAPVPECICGPSHYYTSFDRSILLRQREFSVVRGGLRACYRRRTPTRGSLNKLNTVNCISIRSKRSYGARSSGALHNMEKQHIMIRKGGDYGKEHGGSRRRI